MFKSRIFLILAVLVLTLVTLVSHSRSQRRPRRWT